MSVPIPKAHARGWSHHWWQKLRTATSGLALSVALLSSAGCSGDFDLGRCSDREECKGRIRVASWWGPDAAHVVNLSGGLEDGTNYGVSRVPSEPGYTKSKYLDWVDEQLRLDEPGFDALLLNGGTDVWQRAGCDSGRTSLLAPLDEEFDIDSLTPQFPEELLSGLQCNGHYYALPVGIHQVNYLVYNTCLVGKLESVSQSPQNWSLDDLVTAAGELKGMLDEEGQAGSGEESSVFAVPMGDEHQDALSLFFVENVLLATLESGAKFSEYFSGNFNPTEDRWSYDSVWGKAMTTMGLLSEYFNAPREGESLSPDDALEQVLDGKSALMVTGDWVQPDPNDEQCEVGFVPFPGTTETFEFTSDVFAVPAHGNRLKGATWLAYAMEEANQAAFAREKSAISALAAIVETRFIEGNPVNALPGTLLQTGAFAELPQKLASWAKGNFSSADALEEYLCEQHSVLANLSDQALSDSALPDCD